jgi:hypothetical protein
LAETYAGCYQAKIFNRKIKTIKIMYVFANCGCFPIMLLRRKAVAVKIYDITGFLPKQILNLRKIGAKRKI